MITMRGDNMLPSNIREEYETDEESLLMAERMDEDLILSIIWSIRYGGKIL